MEQHEVRTRIIKVAVEKLMGLCFPEKTNSRRHHAFRVPDDMEPFGFDYHGVSMEVHPVCKSHEGQGREVIVFNIIGINKAGTTKLIAQGVRVG